MSSQDIELQYQLNPSGTTKFTTKSFNYELNFSGEPQTWTLTVLVQASKKICLLVLLYKDFTITW